MNAQEVGIGLASLIVFQYVIGVLILPRLDPNGLGAKLVNGLLAFLPFALAHAAPSMPAAMAARKPSAPKIMPGVGGMLMSFCVTIAGVGLICVVACTGAQVKTGAVVLDRFACVVAQDELGTNEPAIIAELCALPLQDVLDMLARQKAARATARGDGGK